MSIYRIKIGRWVSKEPLTLGKAKKKRDRMKSMFLDVCVVVEDEG